MESLFASFGAVSVWKVLLIIGCALLFIVARGYADYSPTDSRRQQFRDRVLVAMAVVGGIMIVASLFNEVA